MELTSEDRRVMRQIGMGSDIFDLGIANNVSLINLNHPDLIEVFVPDLDYYKGKDGAKPVSAAKLTAAGILEAYEGFKGPWKVDDFAYGVIENSDQDIAVVTPDYGNETQCRHTANLIAAAPRLFEALVQCVELLDGHDPHWREDIELDGYTPEDVINGVLSDG